MHLTNEQIENAERKYSQNRRYGFIRIPEQACNIDEEIERVINIGKRIKSTFTIDDTNRFIYENLIKWVRTDKTMQALHPATNEVIQGDVLKGIYIAGGLGSGKTLCLKVMDTYAREINAIYMESAKVELFTFYPDRSFDIFKEYQAGEDISKYYNYRILSIDDIGSEPKLANYMGTRLNPIRYIIEERGEDESKLNIFTSNYPLVSDVISSQYGERAVSRLWGMCNYFVLTNDDRRKQR